MMGSPKTFGEHRLDVPRTKKPAREAQEPDDSEGANPAPIAVQSRCRRAFPKPPSRKGEHQCKQEAGNADYP